MLIKLVSGYKVTLLNQGDSTIFAVFEYVENSKYQKRRPANCFPHLKFHNGNKLVLCLNEYIHDFQRALFKK